jgi:hypothetical protein
VTRARNTEIRRIAELAREIARLSCQQLDLLKAIPLNRWSEVQFEGYRLRQRKIVELTTEINSIDIPSAA